MQLAVRVHAVTVKSNTLRFVQANTRQRFNQLLNVSVKKDKKKTKEVSLLFYRFHVSQASPRASSLITSKCRSGRLMLKSYLHSVVPFSADTPDVTGIRVFLLELLVDRVLLAVEIALVRGSLFQMITVVPDRATIALLLVHRLTVERFVIRQRARAFRLVARFFREKKEKGRGSRERVLRKSALIVRDNRWTD